jgi:hypothetical protein
MSEPSVTSGRPLPPTTQEELLPGGNDINSPLSAHPNHRKTSQPSDACGEGSSSIKPRRRPGTTSKTLTSPHAGSSRTPQQSTTSATNSINMSSHMSSVNYTRTGRISKAKKGLKVHNCECGRVRGLSEPITPSLDCFNVLMLTLNSHILELSIYGKYFTLLHLQSKLTCRTADIRKITLRMML